MTKISIDYLLDTLHGHQQKSLDTINLVPSENVLSPLSRLPFLLDAHSRYFLDDLRLFGDWSFPSGKELGHIEQEILIPLLKNYAEAEYVNVRPLSGMNCMMVALSAMTNPGDIIYVIPAEAGGHACTTGVAESMGLKVKYIPFKNEFDIDHDLFFEALESDHPKLVYLDQASFLFPLDTHPIRKMIDDLGLKTLIHYDTSHVNGLIFGKVVENPLNRGSHCIGGSTHKTLPGPHKGFLATNDPAIAQNIQDKADQLISQHHMASTISLAITMLEFKDCGGRELMNQIMKNTYAYCDAIPGTSKLKIHAKSRGYTKCHQIWAYVEHGNAREIYNRMVAAGIVVNLFNSLPGISSPAFRMSLSEFSRMGAKEEDAVQLARFMAKIVDEEDISVIKDSILTLRRKFDGPQYCFGSQDIGQDIARMVWADNN